MYLTKRKRREYGFVWTRWRGANGLPYWRTRHKGVNFRIARERYRIGPPVNRWGHGWCVYRGAGAFFTTQRLRRAFRVASDFALLER